MPLDKSDRESYFPAIEKKYGERMSYWFAVMKDLKGQKYPEQVAYLRENYGFSQAHANALVMYSRGSTSSKRFETPKDYFATLDAKQVKTVKAIFKAITSKYPDLELVIAWNQPMLRSGKDYIFGVSAATNHILMAPFSQDVLEKFRPKMKDLDVKKKTIGVPNDWTVDAKLLQSIVKARLAELK
ncbi:unannotated protein [freshwater metagenome]|uniref:Unannotated protein n=1 Tax=freshwater metagenome TaxID=449393 RepID=A0A6J7FF03_9ZZZZ|nr:DUF4287 domain-containing protein [Actinomycetota bacterium]MSW15380.1 DUF4287 domain-containing protein [Actinomycetota bacterium]MSW98809.1 DUF4287 domain-containing protein [Actinomycetota bacterium]MSY82375.1 DUF4287 domain-containing protein [Actinomycetota bacterium]MSZ45866.1 DUF4287 domain-containing protein [Actinomycetota bacterium]